MSIIHHPSDTMLSCFAAGTLDLGQHIAIATHLVSCQRCRDFVRSMEHVGGEMLAGLAPVALSKDAARDVQLRLDAPTRPSAARSEAVTEAEVPALPSFLRRYRFEKWRWLGPSVHMRPIVLPHPSETRVYLLRAGPGTRMASHAHTGIELTCVLAGSFSQSGTHYRPGDFDYGDSSVDHEPVVELGEACICLVAMRGGLHLKGVLGRILQPFIRL
jgi:putative transcriptional regulator